MFPFEASIKIKDIIEMETFAMDKIFYHLLFSLSSCLEKDYSCEGCVTGPKSCDQSLVTTTQEPETQLGRNNLVKMFLISFIFYFQQLLSLVT